MEKLRLYKQELTNKWVVYVPFEKYAYRYMAYDDFNTALVSLKIASTRTYYEAVMAEARERENK